MEFALNLLLAGIVIVFFVLVLLIVIIKIFGSVVQTAQNGNKKKKEIQKSESLKTASVASTPKSVNSADETIPGEIIAVIAAAVDSLYGEKQVKIKSVKRSKNSGSAWRNAGLFENTKPF